MCGLNVTHQALATPEVLARLDGLGTELGRISAELIRFFADSYRRLWGFASPPVHDPVAVARVIDPWIVRCADANVVVELRGEYTRGATVVDLHGYTGRPVNAQVAVELRPELFWDRLIAAITALGARPGG
jgi:purine nucleosidase/pyrimidine-specific ribonucleoside hydrolase